MKVTQAIQKTAEDFHAITKKGIAVYDSDGLRIAGVLIQKEPSEEALKLFFESTAENQEVAGMHFFKVYEEDAPCYILLIQGFGDDIHLLGKVVAAQLEHIISIFRDKENKSSFIQSLLMDNLLQVDIYNKAKRLHIPMERRRLVYLIETKNAKDRNALKVLEQIFVDRAFVTSVDEHAIVLVMELDDKDDEQSMKNIAHTAMDMLNSETMSSVRIGYGSVTPQLKDISRSYKEAKLALDVGRIFYPSRPIISYSSLGIGRLIYQLPMHLCELFMKETFTETPMESLDEETIQSVIKFFENSLNVSETARQLFVHRNTLVYRLEKLQKMTGLDVRQFEDALTFRIAMMVSSYMDYMKNNKTN